MSVDNQTAVDNKALFRRAIEEVWNKGNLDGVGELFTTDVVVHHPLQREPYYGLEGFKQFPRMLRAGFPDVHVDIERVIADGDKIGARWVIRGTHNGVFPLLPMPPTGRQVTIPVNEILRVRDGKLAELWLELNILSVAQQLGVFPALDKAPPQVLWVVGKLQTVRIPRGVVLGAAAAVLTFTARKLLRPRRHA